MQNKSKDIRINLLQKKYCRAATHLKENVFNLGCVAQRGEEQYAFFGSLWGVFIGFSLACPC